MNIAEIGQEGRITRAVSCWIDAQDGKVVGGASAGAARPAPQKASATTAALVFGLPLSIAATVVAAAVVLLLFTAALLWRRLAIP